MLGAPLRMASRRTPAVATREQPSARRAAHSYRSAAGNGEASPSGLSFASEVASGYLDDGSQHRIAEQPRRAGSGALRIFAATRCSQAISSDVSRVLASPEPAVTCAYGHYGQNFMGGPRFLLRARVPPGRRLPPPTRRQSSTRDCTRPRATLALAPHPTRRPPAAADAALQTAEESTSFARRRRARRAPELPCGRCSSRRATR